MDSEKQGQGSNCLLSTTQIAHWLEAFARRDTIIIDTIQIALIGIQESLSGIISSQRFVNTINSFRHMVQTFIKARHPIILDLLKRLLKLSPAFFTCDSRFQCWKGKFIVHNLTFLGFYQLLFSRFQIFDIFNFRDFYDQFPIEI